MDFEFLINKPHDEFDLFMLVCKSIQNNLESQKNKYQVLHLKSAGEKEMTIEKAVSLENGSIAGDYYFDSYYTEPTISIRYDNETAASVMLVGQYYTAIYDVTPSEIKVDFKNDHSAIPGRKDLCKIMSPQQIRMAFCDIGDQLTQKKSA